MYFVTWQGTAYRPSLTEAVIRHLHLSADRPVLNIHFITLSLKNLNLQVTPTATFCFSNYRLLRLLVNSKIDLYFATFFPRGFPAGLYFSRTSTRRRHFDQIRLKCLNSWGSSRFSDPTKTSQGRRCAGRGYFAMVEAEIGVCSVFVVDFCSVMWYLLNK